MALKNSKKQGLISAYASSKQRLCFRGSDRFMITRALFYTPVVIKLV